MATAESVKAKLQALLDSANAATGNGDADLTAAVASLIAGFGQGGEPPILEELSVTENGEYTPDEGVDGFSKVTVEVEGSGGVETGEITLTGFHNSDRPLTIPVSAKHSHILVVPPVMSEFKATYAGKYQHAFYAAENYGYIGMSINAVTEAGARAIGNAYWEDETQTVFRADFTETEVTVYPESYAAFGIAGATYKWFAW